MTPSTPSPGRRRRGEARQPRELQLGGELRRLARATQLLEAEALAESGITRAQSHALLAIQQMARPSMRMLAAEMGLAPSTVTRLIDPLVRRELVDRSPDPDDRRVIGVSLTPAGKRTLRRVEQSLQAAYARVATQIPRTDHTQLRDSLLTLQRAIEHARLQVGS